MNRIVAASSEHFRSHYKSKWISFLDTVFEHRCFCPDTHGFPLAAYLPAHEQVELLCRLSDKTCLLRHVVTHEQASRLFGAIDFKNTEHSLLFRWVVVEIPADLHEVSAMFDALLSEGVHEQ